MTMQILGVKIGMTFSGGLIDFLLFGVLPGRTAWWWVIIVGLVLAVIYYFGFRFAIRKWNLKHLVVKWQMQMTAQEKQKQANSS